MSPLAATRGRGRQGLAASVVVAAAALASCTSPRTFPLTTPAIAATAFGYSLTPTRLFRSPVALSRVVTIMVATMATTASLSISVAAAEADVAAATAIVQEDVPERLRLKPELEAYPVKDVSLREIDASAGAPVKEAGESVRLEDVAASHSGTVGSVAFVVRRPGCQLCREHGQHLSELAVSAFGNKFGMWGVVKETSVDDEGLVEFAQNYFSFDLYRDEGLSLYSALGNRSIFRLTTWNPLRWYKWLQNVSNRLQSKNITGNFKGEGIVQGGILIFDRTGTLRFAYEEETGGELKTDEILAALRVLENESTNGAAAAAADAASFSQVKEDL